MYYCDLLKWKFPWILLWLQVRGHLKNVPVIISSVAIQLRLKSNNTSYFMFIQVLPFHIWIYTKFISYCSPVLAIFHSWSIHFNTCFFLSPCFFFSHFKFGKLIGSMRQELIQLLLLTTFISCQLCAGYQIAVNTIESYK